MAETTTCSLKILISPFSIVEVGKLLSAKGQRVTTLGFEGNVVSLTAIQLFHCNGKAATDNSSTNGRGYVQIQFYLQ